MTTGRAARLGILFRRGEALQRLASVTRVAFDKTGTLTQGKPVVTEAEFPGGDPTVLTRIAALEARSEHPLAAAIMAAAAGPVPPVEAFEAVPGRGVRGVVEGRSLIVGKPQAMLLLAANATVTIAHSRTKDLPALCREADILIAAVGRPEMIRGDWIKPGAAVIDVGINRTDDGLVGDVAFDEAAEVAGRITPVPGGVGPMTIAFLLANTLDAAVRRTGLGTSMKGS